MSRNRFAATLAAAGALSLMAAAPAVALAGQDTQAEPGQATHPRAAMREARQLLRAREARITGASRRERFTDEQNVFLPSTIRLRNLETPGRANATVPAFRGVGPDGRANVWYAITEAADYDVAKVMGLNYAPKLAYGRDSAGSQKVTLRRGQIRFRGAVDFAPRRALKAPRAGNAFPPRVARPGAVGDAEWSSSVVLPSGSVVNIAAVSNATGDHDRLVRLDRGKAEATIALLDGWQGGDRNYYHFVTDSSDKVAATIEQGVYTPRLAKLAAFGKSLPSERSALLGFSPNANGETGANNPERQGLNSTIVDNDRDPVNVFPLDPDNDKRSANNYSPMWDAHVSQWTKAAIDSGQRRSIRGFEDLAGLVSRGLVTSADGSPGSNNSFVAGLRATLIIINCPVIAQPFEKEMGEGDAPPARL